MGASNLSDTEFKTMVIRMLREFRERVDEHSEKLNKERVTIKKCIKKP